MNLYLNIVIRDSALTITDINNLFEKWINFVHKTISDMCTWMAFSFYVSIPFYFVFSSNTFSLSVFLSLSYQRTIVRNGLNLTH